MPDIQKLNDTKEKILMVLRRQGPSFPARISRETTISPLFVAAILSELVAEKKLIMSAMRVGSSPLYILPGQEPDLEKFAQYLNSKEREAYEILKSSSVISDELQDPAIRVALRKIRDFAVPITVRNAGEEKLFWKYFLTQDAQAQEKVESFLGLSRTPEPKVNKVEKAKELVVEEKENPLTSNQAEPETLPQVEKKTIKKTQQKKDPQFAIKMRDYLQGKDIELLQELNAKPKEFTGKVRIDTTFGKQEFYLIAKDKKKITEEELIIAIQRAQAEKMPALVMAPGEPDKIAKEYLKDWRNLIKFERVKL